MWWWLPRRRWTRVLAAAIATPVFVASGIAGYYYGQFSLLVEARLQGERVRTIPRVYGRPLTLRVKPESPVYTDPNATVAWSSNLEPEFKTDISLKTLLGLRSVGTGTPFSFQEKFHCTGGPMTRLR